MKTSSELALRLPIGYDDFGLIIADQLTFVDKSLFIQEIIQDTAQVILITRPRRFGKTLNMSLLHHFFAEQVLERKTAGMFEQLQIAQCPEVMAHQGQYPVISITFKDIKNETYEKCYEGLCQAFEQTYSFHQSLMSHEKLSPAYQQQFEAVLYGKADEKAIRFALLNLTHYLYLCYGVRPIVLIDEYDAPIQAGYQYGYYDKAIQLMRSVLSPALKNNPYLKKAVLTGVVRVAKEGMFSGLNNVRVYSLFHQRYSDFFGFTEPEVQNLLVQSGLADKEAEVRHWYNGYQIGKTRIYNPWSMMCYLIEQGTPDCYWVNTSDNFLLKELIIAANVNVKAQFQTLLQGNSIQAIITDNFILPELHEVEETLWALLVMAGYLTPTAQIRSDHRPVKYTLDIPNQEIRSLYAQFVCEWLAKGKSRLWYENFIDQLLLGNIPVFAEGMHHIILQIVSAHDLGQQPEVFYHGLMLGLILYLESSQYRVLSNRESGYGRYDIAIIPHDNRKLGIILELKSVPHKHAKPNTIQPALIKAAQDALAQINHHAYIADFKHLQFQQVCKIGLAFSGKHLHIEYAIENLKPV